MEVLVTGAAGFIGFHVAQRCLAEGHSVVGLDNLNDYYDPLLKLARLEQLQEMEQFQFVRADIANESAMRQLFEGHRFHTVIHLAAQAGVRNSIERPQAYIDSNLVGFANVLECCRHYQVQHLIFASSSSVYGANTKMPFSEGDSVDHPVSLYAATKKSNEMMAHSYSHLYGLPVTGLRFFTVYGPWGRPDMAYFSFTKDILSGKPIRVFNLGKMKRDFTYIDDITEGIHRLMVHIPKPNPYWNRELSDPATSSAPYRIYNIGNNEPINLLFMIYTLEDLIGRRAQLTLEPMQPGDVEVTYADIESLQRDVGFRPSTSIEFGLKRFVEWYLEYESGRLAETYSTGTERLK